MKAKKLENYDYNEINKIRREWFELEREIKIKGLTKQLSCKKQELQNRAVKQGIDINLFYRGKNNFFRGW